MLYRCSQLSYPYGKFSDPFGCLVRDCAYLCVMMHGMSAEDQEESRNPFALHDTRWFAEQIGMSESWIRGNISTLPHHKIGRLLKFDEHCLEILRDRTAVAPADPMQRTQRSRNTRRK